MTDRMLCGCIIFGFIAMGVVYGLVTDYLRTHRKAEQAEQRPKRTKIYVDNEQFNDIAKKAISQQTMKSYIAQIEMFNRDCEIVKENDNDGNSV